MARDRERQIKESARNFRGQKPLNPTPMHAQQTQEQKAEAGAGRGQMVAGVLLMLGGAVVSLITFLASEPGGVFYVFGGVIMVGGISFVSGLVGWLNTRD